MKRIGFLLAILAAAMFCGSPNGLAQTAPKKITFLTNYAFNGRYAPFFVGREKGFYKEAGFDLTITPATGSGFVIAAVDAGKAEYGLADFSSLVQSVPKGAKIKAFMVYTDATPSGLASVAPFPTPESLLGKKITASLADNVRVIVPVIFDGKGLDASKIQWQAADPGVYFSLLLSGQTDLITASVDGDLPALRRVATAQGKQVHFASFADWGYDVFGFVIVGSKANFEKNPGEAQRFAEATKKAVRYAIDHPDETARIMVKANPTMNYDTVLAQWTQSIKVIDTPYVAQHGYGMASADRLQHSIALVKEALDINAAIEPEDVYLKAGN